MSTATFPELRVGNLRIVRVPELELNDFSATQLLPDLTPDVLASHPEWLDPRIYDVATGTVRLSVHTWVVQTVEHTLLIDTGAGNDKTRPTMKMLDGLHEPYLERLAAVGVQPEAVDFVLLTHVHADHVGWNTRLQDGRWAPTFPNATTVCSALEWRYGAALAAGDEQEIAAARAQAGLGEPMRTPVAGVFEDSMAPLAAASRMQLIAVDGSEVLPGVRFLPTPGHSIDHAAIAFESAGETVLFGGDVLHHPFEIYDLDLVSMFCEFPDVARRSRRWLLEHAVQTGARYFSSHFPDSSRGRIVRRAQGYGWQFSNEGA
ncbi:MAG: MBL fold metallo-hydrolase [Rhodospirillales bacterium]|nr:MBL fold metallo-hydrolase [Acetobacter sp.]